MMLIPTHAPSLEGTVVTYDPETKRYSDGTTAAEKIQQCVDFAVSRCGLSWYNTLLTFLPGLNDTAYL